MAQNITFYLGAAQSNLTRLQAGHWKITALEKRAGEAGKRNGCDLDVRLTN